MIEVGLLVVNIFVLAAINYRIARLERNQRRLEAEIQEFLETSFGLVGSATKMLRQISGRLAESKKTDPDHRDQLIN